MSRRAPCPRFIASCRIGNPLFIMVIGRLFTFSKRPWRNLSARRATSQHMRPSPAHLHWWKCYQAWYPQPLFPVYGMWTQPTIRYTPNTTTHFPQTISYLNIRDSLSNHSTSKESSHMWYEQYHYSHINPIEYNIDPLVALNYHLQEHHWVSLSMRRIRSCWRDALGFWWMIGLPCLWWAGRLKKWDVWFWAIIAQLEYRLVLKL